MWPIVRFGLNFFATLALLAVAVIGGLYLVGGILDALA